MSGGGGKESRVGIFVRVRPSPNNSPDCSLSEDGAVSIRVPRELSAGFANHQRELYDFKFDHGFGTDAKQHEVFDQMARDIVLSCLDGYNGTIFAYGQTGSGKTFTITGGVEHFNDRGIIPRSLSLIFQEIERRSDAQYSVFISYLEIYNEKGYDLLDKAHDAMRLEDLPKVRMLQDANGSLHLQGLKVHQARTESDAIELLFIGDTNRVIDETPQNPVSSRSHCIFTVFIEARVPGSERTRMSKLHLVDLAGSERVSKSGIEGKLLTEAKFINVSLHYLESVIKALSENQEYVPYRNSMMTSVLRDSLGGNCKTAMIATISFQPDNIGESIGTCRFAQRVACIATNAVVNEHVDPKMIIKRLKQEVAALKAELAFMKGVSADDSSLGPLTEEERDTVRERVQAFVDDPSPDAMLQFSDLRQIRESWAVLRQLARSGAGRAAEAQKQNSRAETDGLQVELQKTRQLVAQRDSELRILVQKLERYERLAAEQGITLSEGKRAGADGMVVTASMQHRVQQQQQQQQQQRVELTGAASSASLLLASGARASSAGLLTQAPASAAPLPAPALPLEQLEDPRRAQAFFMQTYSKRKVLEENKRLLQEKIDEAKGLGQVVTQAKEQLVRIRGALERVRTANLVRGDAALSQAGGAEDSGDAAPSVPQSAEEEALLRDMSEWKRRYGDAYGALKQIKPEIESLQALYQKNLERMNTDFYPWLEQQRQLAVLQANGGAPAASALGPPLTAAAAAATAAATAAALSAPSTGASAAGAGARPIPVTGDPTADATVREFYNALARFSSNTAPARPS